MTVYEQPEKKSIPNKHRHPKIDRLQVSNYRSIGKADIGFQPLTFLVGPNGSGKSNLLDAFRFVAESMVRPIDQVLRDRGGIDEVRRKSGGHPTHFGIRIDFTLPNGKSGWYAIKIGAKKPKGFVIDREECEVLGGDTLREHFLVQNGKVQSTQQPVAVVSDRPYLVAASATPVFRPVFDLLSRITIYNINPSVIRELQSTDAGDVLFRDGSNLAAVFRRLARDDNKRIKRIQEYISKIVTSIIKVEPRALSNRETLEFRQSIPGAKAAWRFPASSMSDGTLRALGVLTAIFQAPPSGEADIPIIGIEEPEVAVHPHALAVLLDALQEAAGERQIVVTSHSPDLLDRDTILDDSLLAVVLSGGATEVALVDRAGREAIRQGLCTPGELMRQNRLIPDPVTSEAVKGRQLDIFKHRPDDMS
jgi:predicted ATPase